MPSWTQPPKSPWELMKEYVDAVYSGTALACDAGMRCTHISNDDMEQGMFDVMVADLLSKFPGAF